MNNYDDVFTSQAEQPTQPEQQQTPFDKEKWAESKKQEREKAFALINDTAVEVSGNDELLKTYLDVQNRFDRYSVGNALLITAQMPEATKLADFDTWQKNDIHVSKGESAITILEPGDEYTKEDGTISVHWNVKKVFDISQTREKRPETPKVTLDPRLMLRSLIHNAPCKLTLTPNMPEQFNALYNPDKKEIMLRQGLDAATIFRDLSHELALAHMDKDKYSRSEFAFTANCASYILCRRNGVPVDAFSFQRKPEDFSKMKGQDVRVELEKIRDVTNKISSDMRQFLEAGSRTTKNRDEKAR